MNQDMRLIISLLLSFALFSPIFAFAQDQDYHVIKSDRSEEFVLPYSASNRDISHPLVYTFDTPKKPSWELRISNSQTYIPSDDSKTVIRIEEPAPSVKYIELTVFGGESKVYWVSVNTEHGYARVYSQEENGWSTDNPIIIGHDESHGLSVTDGKRIVIDGLNLEGFAVGSISVYGNDDERTAPNTSAGEISFQIVYGSFQQSSLYFVPIGVMVGVGGLVGGLLIFKKRKPE